MTTIEVHDQMAEQRLESLREFTRAHGVDPNDVPLGSVIEVAGDKVTFELYKRNEQGERFAVGNDIARTTITVDKVRDVQL